MSERPRSFLTDGDHYDAAHAYKVDDLAFWASFVGAGTRVVELACGTGRIAIPLARAGAIVTAIDAAPSMLARARHKAAAAHVDIAWIEGDMRTFDVPAQDLAIMAYNAINLLEVDDAIACLLRVKACLVPGGRLVIETFVPTLKKLTPAEDEPINSYRLGEVDVRVRARRTYDPALQRRRMELAIQLSDRTEPEHDAFDFHVYFPSELRLLVERAGFTIEHVYGGYDRARFGTASLSCIVDCRA